jgi:hypothetical protein
LGKVEGGVKLGGLAISEPAKEFRLMKRTKAFWMGMAFWVIYMGCRYWLIHTHPATNWETYFYQDIAITGFRLPLFIAMLILAGKTMSFRKLGFQKGPLLPAITVGVLMLAVNFIRLFSPHVFQAKPIYFMLELSINLLIAASEEISFRGLFYVCLSEMESENVAVYLGTVLFTLMHAFYLPVSAFPFIFIEGLTFAKLRSLGVSLTVLITIHWLIDFLVFLYPPIQPNPLPIPIFTLITFIPLAVVFYWSRRLKKIKRGL